MERSAVHNGYKYEKGTFVLFAQEELMTLEASSRMSEKNLISIQW